MLLNQILDRSAIHAKGEVVRIRKDVGRGSRRSCRRHSEQAAGGLRHHVQQHQVPHLIQAEHEHGARAGDGTLQQAPVNYPLEHDQCTEGD